MRINGIGSAYLGFGPRDADDRRTATLWFTFFYLPVKPLRRHVLRLHPRRSSGQAVEPLDETPLDRSEIRRTRLYGFLLFPLLILWPVPFAVAAVGPLEEGNAPWWAAPAILLAVVWLIASTWKLADWHDARSEPTKLPRARATDRA